MSTFAGAQVAVARLDPLPEAPSSLMQAQAVGTISGVVKDIGGQTVAGAHVTLISGPNSDSRSVDANAEGHYAFTGVPAGNFELTVTEEGLAAEVIAGTLDAGADYVAADTALRIATASTTIDVSYTRDELAVIDMKVAEEQRILGVLPNFFVTYSPNPSPLTAKRKYELALRGAIDPGAVFVAAFVGTVEQAADTLPGYGQGWDAYGKRIGATMANTASGTILRDAFFPSIFRQDPRYYYKGTGTKWARARYALSTAVICKGDNGKWQPDISDLFGNISAGALTVLYYPQGSKNGASTIFENAGINTLGVGVGHLLEELVLSRLTSKKKQ